MEKIVSTIAHVVAVKQQLDEEREAVIKYGMLALFQMTFILLLAVVFGILTGTLLECFIVYCTVGALRKFTGGAHAHSMGGCIVVSVTTICLMAVVSRYVFAPRMSPLFMFLIVTMLYVLYFWLVWKNAPVDSPNKPIRKPEKIKRLRKGSFFLLCCLFVVSLLLTFINIYIDDVLIYSTNWALMLALGWQSLTLTKFIRLLFHNS